MHPEQPNRYDEVAVYARHGRTRECAEAMVDGGVYHQLDLRLSETDAREVDAHLRARGLTLVDDGGGWWLVMTPAEKAECVIEDKESLS